MSLSGATVKMSFPVSKQQLKSRYSRGHSATRSGAVRGAVDIGSLGWPQGRVHHWPPPPPACCHLTSLSHWASPCLGTRQQIAPRSWGGNYLQPPGVAGSPSLFHIPGSREEDRIQTRPHGGCWKASWGMRNGTGDRSQVFAYVATAFPQFHPDHICSQR